MVELGEPVDGKLPRGNIKGKKGLWQNSLNRILAKGRPDRSATKEGKGKKFDQILRVIRYQR